MHNNIDFETFYKLSLDLQLITTFSGEIVHCNPTARALFQQTHAAPSPSSIFDFVSPDEHDFFAIQLAQSAHSGMGSKFLTRLNAPSGIRWLLWNTEVDSQHEQMYWIGQDVSELKRSAASLEILEEVTETGIWELDRQTNIPYWSKKTHQIHGTDPKLFHPGISDALAFFPPLGRVLLQNAIEKLEQDGKPYNLKLPFITASGNERIVNARGYAQLVGNKSIRYYGTFKDITEEVKKLENEHKMHKRMELALDFSKIGVWEYRVDGDILEWDPRMFAIYEVAEEDFTGTLYDWQIRVHPDDIGPALQLLDVTMQTGKPYISEFRVITRDQELKHIRAMASVLFDESRKVTHLIGVNLDVTADIERKEQLEKAKEAAEAANQAQARFLALMSHEIRTPLNGLIGSLQILEGLAIANRESQFISQSLNSARTLVAIINDILDYSKVSANKMTLEEMPLNLCSLLQQVINEQTVLANRKHIALALMPADNLPGFFKLDPLRFKQVMTNLVSNAIKFTHQGYVSVSYEVEYEPQAMLIIRVRDTGIGIKHEQLETLFTPFTQADAATTRQYGGSGLGLSIVQRLVILMGGTISVDSTPGIGSCFTVKLPRSPCTTGTVQAADNTEPSAVAPPDLSHLKVIIAEDNEINQLVVDAFMQECNTQATFVDNGAELVEAVKTTKYDLILCDIRMPVMNGIEACQLIRQINTTIPILAFTANVMQDDVRAYMEAGFNDVIGKPVERQQLFEQLAVFSKPQE